MKKPSPQLNLTHPAKPKAVVDDEKPLEEMTIGEREASTRASR